MAGNGVTVGLLSLSPYMRLHHHGGEHQLVVHRVPFALRPAWMSDTPIIGPDITGIEDARARPPPG